MMKKIQEIKEYYDRRYTTYGKRVNRKPTDYDIYFSKLAKYRKLEGKILDVGCGEGYLFQVKPSEDLKTYGLDISPHGLKFAKDTNPKSYFVLGQGEYLPFMSSIFNIIICLGSLEHFLSIDNGLEEMKRVARPDGLFCFLVPNKVHYRPDRKSKWGIKKVEGDYLAGSIGSCVFI